MRIAAHAAGEAVSPWTFNAVCAPPRSGILSTIDARLAPVEKPEYVYPVETGWLRDDLIGPIAAGLFLTCFKRNTTFYEKSRRK